MDTTARQGMSIGRGVLQAIFAVFLGLMITAVVGVGAYTFYPGPGQATQDQIDQLYQQRSQIEGCGKEPVARCRTWEELTAGERAQITQIDSQVSELQQVLTDQTQAWRQRTSILLVVIATALMATSLLLAEGLAVMSNGILLGGLFTMLYGVGWGLASGNSVTRFLVMLAALAVSLGLGYAKFVRGRRGPQDLPAGGPATPAGGGEATGSALAELAARVADLERRLAAAAAGLGGGVQEGGVEGAGGRAAGGGPAGRA